MCNGGGAVSELPGGVSAVGRKEKDAYRLPEDVRPTHYDLVFKTDLEELRFDGEGVVHLKIVENTKSITLNYNPSLHLTHLSLTHPSLATPYTYDVSSVPSSLLSVDTKQERLVISLPEQLGDGVKKGDQLKLRMAWTSELNGSMLGYYRSSWRPDGKDGKEAFYALTQFEPTAARRAFPCWDEPLLKSTYSISLISRKGLVSLSNMPAVGPAKPWNGGGGGEELGGLLEKKGDGEWEITEFVKTPLVSTYLVAFANGEFASLESSYVSPLSGKTIPLKSYATPDHIKQAQFALDVKARPCRSTRRSLTSSTRCPSWTPSPPRTLTRARWRTGG
jgi:aminopeptidase 2